jgi:hypothetical protein
VLTDVFGLVSSHNTPIPSRCSGKSARQRCVIKSDVQSLEAVAASLLVIPAAIVVFVVDVIGSMIAFSRRPVLNALSRQSYLQ